MGDKCPNIFFRRKYPSNLLKNKKTEEHPPHKTNSNLCRSLNAGHYCDKINSYDFEEHKEFEIT